MAWTSLFIKLHYNESGSNTTDSVMIQRTAHKEMITRVWEIPKSHMTTKSRSVVVEEINGCRGEQQCTRTGTEPGQRIRDLKQI